MDNQMGPEKKGNSAAARILMIEFDSEKSSTNNPAPVDYEIRSGFIARSPRIGKAATHSQAGPAGVFALMCGTICCSFLTLLVFLTLLNAASLASIVIGALHFHDCPAQPHIPVMLITLGVLAIVICILDGLDRVNDRRAKMEARLESDGRGVGDEVEYGTWTVKRPTCLMYVSSVLKLLQLALFVYTCVIVYRIATTVVYEPEPEPATGHPLPEPLTSDGIIHWPHGVGHAPLNHYCNPVVYMFSFWFTTATLILLFMGLAFLICICLSGALFIALSEL